MWIRTAALATRRQIRSESLRMPHRPVKVSRCCMTVPHPLVHLLLLCVVALRMRVGESDLGALNWVATPVQPPADRQPPHFTMPPVVSSKKEDARCD